ncbi:MAG: hypothetical protein Q7S88_02730 [Candidatus Daviesbacteria bacterium]|nr:hypothetical protein [Candidatus Daviesbacteria bacterium]
MINRIKQLEFRIRDLQVLFFIALFFILFALFSNPVLAQEATKSASPSAQLKAKIRALQDDIASKAAQIKHEISKKLQNKAFAGTIKSKSQDSLTVSEHSGSVIITVNQDTIYGGKTKTTFENLKVEDFIVALGDVDENQVLTARKIIKQTLPTARLGVFGELTSITKDKVVVKPKTTDEKSSLITLNLSTDSSYNQGVDEVTASTLKSNQAVFVIYQKETDKNLVSSLYIIPQASGTNNLQKSKEASRAAQASSSAKIASPSAKPKNN